MPDIQPIKDYLCVEFPSGGTISLVETSYNGHHIDTMNYVAFSKDGRNWETYTKPSNTSEMTVTAGGKVYIKGSGSAMGMPEPGSGDAYITGWSFHIYPGGSYIYTKLTGNIMSLLYEDDFENEDEVPNNAFMGIFMDSCRINDVSELKLPATTVGDYAYSSMFGRSLYSTQCTLKKAPKLPATNIGIRAYQHMFNGTGLEEMPDLPATVLAYNCYGSMFARCGIKEAKVLPATILADGCYAGMFSQQSTDIHLPHNMLPAITLANNCYLAMFSYCRSMKNIPSDLLPATTLATACYNNMFGYCESLEFVPDRLLPATVLANNCYASMFDHCTSLIRVPRNLLPATTHIDETSGQEVTSLAEFCYSNMFANCSSLSKIPMHLLPATILANYCYTSMFSGCSTLSRIPANLLPAATLASGCYGSMFAGTAIEEVPEGLLPANTLVYICYGSMFSNCKSLTKIGSPIIPKDTVVSSNSLADMFAGCSALEEVDANLLPTTNIARSEDGTRCYSRMFYGCTLLKSAPDIKATHFQYGACYQMFANCTSLTKAPALKVELSRGKPMSTLYDYGNGSFKEMFKGCTSLTDISNIEFGEDTELAIDSCESMFEGCTALKDASSLALTSEKVSHYAYKKMFYGCTSLEDAPAVVYAGAYTEGTKKYLGSYVCESMFENCTALKSIPELTATEIGQYTYHNMFKKCVGLTDLSSKHIKATILASYCYTYMFSECSNLIKAPSIDATEFKEYYCCAFMFNGCESLTTLQPITIDGAYVGTNAFYHTFQNCKVLADISMIAFNTRKVRESCYNGMFSGCIALNVLPTNFTIYTELDTGHNGKNCCSKMFYGCKALTTIPNLPSEPVTYGYSEMFANCKGLVNLTGKKLPGIYLTDYCYASMFWGCETLATVPSDFIAATSFAGNSCCNNMFYNCKALTIAPYLNPVQGSSETIWANKDAFRAMFAGCESLTHMAYIGNNTVAKLTFDYLSETAMQDMFSGCSSLEEVPQLYVKYAGKNCCKNMFKGCTSLEEIPTGFLQNIVQSDSVKAVYCQYWASGMFMGCTSLRTVDEYMFKNQSLFDYCYKNMFNGCTSLVDAPKLPCTTLAPGCYKWMFKGCTSLESFGALPATSYTTAVRGDDTGESSDKNENTPYYGMFEGCTALTGCPTMSISGEGAIQPYTSMFKGCTSLADVSNITFSKTSLYAVSMFSGCTLLATVPKVSGVDVHCYGMFLECDALQAVELDIQMDNDITNCCNFMFRNCDNLARVTGKVEGVYSNAGFYFMFYGCSKLTVTPTFNIAGITKSNCCTNMFDGCTILTSVNGTFTITAFGGDNSFGFMFYHCVALTTPPTFVVNTNRAGISCYSNMFTGCNALQTIPESLLRHITTLDEGCYQSMFKNCKALAVELPAGLLPAIEAKRDCYRGMFEYSAVTGMEDGSMMLETFANDCCSAMFRGCSDITSVYCIFRTWQGGTTDQWLLYVPEESTRVFTKRRNVYWGSRSSSGIPDKWTVNEVDV